MYDRLCDDKKLRRRRLFWLSSDELLSLLMILLLGRSCSAILMRELWLINFIIGQRHQKDSKDVTVNAFPSAPTSHPSPTPPSYKTIPIHIELWYHDNHFIFNFGNTHFHVEQAGSKSAVDSSICSYLLCFSCIFENMLTIWIYRGWNL